MNVFVLCTGRCGSVTFIEACRHISNYSAAHESRSHLVGSERLAFPPRHIEADNRLSWYLGRLDQAYGDTAFYVHLLRDAEATAKSFVRRYETGIIKAYADGIIMGKKPASDPMEVCLDYVNTVNSNIAAFLRDKSQTMTFHLEQADADFRVFWERTGAEGDLDAALAQWQQRHNASSPGLLPQLLRHPVRTVARALQPQSPPDDSSRGSS